MSDSACKYSGLSETTLNRPNKFSNRFFLIIPRARFPGSIRPAPRDLLAWQKPRPRSPSADVGNWNHRHPNWTSPLQTMKKSGIVGPVALTCILKTYFQDMYYLIKLYLYNLYNCLLWVNHWGIQTWKWKLLKTRLPGLPFWTIRASTSFRFATSANHWLIHSFLSSNFAVWNWFLIDAPSQQRGPRILESCKTTMLASASLSQSMVWIRSNTSNCVP